MHCLLVEEHEVLQAQQVLAQAQALAQAGPVQRSLLEVLMAKQALQPPQAQVALPVISPFSPPLLVVALVLQAMAVMH